MFPYLCESSSTYVCFYSQIKRTLLLLRMIEHSNFGRKNNKLLFSLCMFLVIPFLFVDY